MEVKKEGKRKRLNKIVRCKNLKDSYKFYRKELKLKGITKAVNRDLYPKICKDFNKELVGLIINKSEEIYLPCGLGTLTVIKREANLFRKEKKHWPVDWKKSKELGYKVYHIEDNYYKIQWIKKKAKLTNKKYYKFYPCRQFKRMICTAVKYKNLDYFYQSNTRR